MKRTNFWSPEAIRLLENSGRQDLIDRGDALAERVSALINTVLLRLRSYVKYGDLYCDKGGESVLENHNAVQELDEFVNVRLRQEIEALEHVLSVFDDLTDRSVDLEEADESFGLPDWY